MKSTGEKLERKREKHLRKARERERKARKKLLEGEKHWRIILRERKALEKIILRERKARRNSSAIFAQRFWPSGSKALERKGILFMCNKVMR